MKRTQKESVEGLLKGIEDAKNMREFDYIKDLKMLLNAYTKTYIILKYKDRPLNETEQIMNKLLHIQNCTLKKHV